MTTRRKFTGALLAAGTLANFALVAGTRGPGSGNNGNGAKADTVQPPSARKSNARIGQDQTQPPACSSAGGKEDHVE